MRKIIIVLACCVVLLLLGYTSYRGYQVWKQTHGLSMAKGFLAKADTRNAFLALQQVLRANPRNLEANRMMAGLMEADHAPGVLQWRQRVLQLDPASIEDRLALAQAAILNRDYALATNTLAGATESSKQTSIYHSMAGMAAMLGGQADEAEAQFNESIRLDPTNPFPQLNLAVVRLHRTNSLDMAEARNSLQRIIMNSTNTTLCNQARRELILDAMRFKDYATALNLSKDQVGQTNSAFSDKLLRLEVLKKTQNSEFNPALALYRSEAVNDPAEISDLTRWQMINLPTGEALGWLQRLPVGMKTNQTVEVLTATCQLELKDWQGLQNGIQQENWGDSDPARPWNNREFMRHAFIARALRAQGLTEASTAEWVVAVKAASDQRHQIVQAFSFKTLFDLALSWDWGTEAEQILWTVVNQYPEERWASPILRNALILQHRTKSLMQLLEIMNRRAPNDLDAQNDLASTAMLLGDQDCKPYDLARYVYESAPGNPSYVSTYAFSLYQQGKYADALKVIQQLSPKDLQQPAIGGYYGLILKANGKKAEAKSYLSHSSKGLLLPEEQALFTQAEAGL